MARGRVIDKEIHSSEVLGNLAIEARYLYKGIIVHSDDDGRMKATAKYLKAVIYPFDEGLRTETVKAWRDSLFVASLIVLYAVDGQEYLYHPNWRKWQPIRDDRYKPSQLPKPTTENEMKKIGLPPVDNSQKIDGVATSRQPSDNQGATLLNPTLPNSTLLKSFGSDKAEPKGGSKRRKKPTPEGYSEAVAHILASYKTKKGANYPFSNIDGAILKRGLMCYGLAEIKALWDIFLKGNWDFEKDGKLVHLPHDLLTFQLKWTRLIDDKEWKPLTEKYRGEISPTIKIQFQSVPHANHQAQKLEAFRKAETLK